MKNTYTANYNSVFSTKNDNILIFHTGLGNENKLLEFPATAVDADLYAPELMSTFKYLHKRKSYKNVNKI